MGLKRDEIALANNGQGCLGKAHLDEPVFILRAQDKLAPMVVEYWAAKVMEASYAHGSSNPSRDNPKVKEARALAHQMRAWQELNTCKVPD